MDVNCGELVESMGVANGRGYQDVGAASGWNLWVWLASVVVRRYIIGIRIIIIAFPYSTCISSFFGSIIPISLFIFKCFFVLVAYISLQYSERGVVDYGAQPAISWRLKGGKSLVSSLAKYRRGRAKCSRGTQREVRSRKTGISSACEAGKRRTVCCNRF